MNKISLLSLLGFFLFSISVNSQTLPQDLELSCASGYTDTTIFEDSFEYTTTDEIKAGGWSGDISQGTGRPANGKWGTSIGSNPQSSWNSNVKNGTGPDASYLGGRFFMFEANGATDQGEIISPAIDLTSGSNVSGDALVEFYMYAFGKKAKNTETDLFEESMGKLEVFASDNKNVFSDAALFTHEGNYQSQSDEDWIKVRLSLAAYIGKTVYLKFKYTAVLDKNLGDMCIDALKVSACVDTNICIAGGLSFSNETTEGVDITYNPRLTETKWEYLVQKSTEATPDASASGVVLDGDFNETIVGLEHTTSYDIYVRAYCEGIGASDWTSPQSFNTLISYTNTIECGTEFRTTFCYASNFEGDKKTKTYTYVSSDPDGSIGLFINEGRLGDRSFTNNDPALVVTDGDGVVLYNGSGTRERKYFSLKGMSFYSDTGSISFHIANVDMEGTCADLDEFDQLLPIDYTVKCMSCDEPPVVEYDYDFPEDCAVSNEYYIAVDVKDMKGASTVYVTNDYNTTQESTTTTGVVRVGPFPFDKEVEVYVSSNSVDSGCFTQRMFNVDSCPPSNDDIENAMELQVTPYNTTTSETNWVYATLKYATASEDASIPTPSCNTKGATNDIWFKMTAKHPLYTFAPHVRQSVKDGEYGSSKDYIDHVLYEKQEDGSLKEMYCYQSFSDYASERPFLVSPVLTIGTEYYYRVFSQSDDFTDVGLRLTLFDATEKMPSTCEGGEALCFDETGVAFTRPTIEVPNRIVPNTSCTLEWMTNAKWPTFEVAEDGVLDFEVEMQNVGTDAIDIALYGPFTDQDEYCSEIYQHRAIDCSVGGGAKENVSVPNAKKGEKYAFLIINRGGEEELIKVTQTNIGNTGAAELASFSPYVSQISPDPICSSDSSEMVDLSNYDSYLNVGNNTYTIKYFATETMDAEVSQIEVKAGESTTVYAQIISEFDCASSTSFELNLTTPPLANTITPSLDCSVTSFDLTSLISEITGGASGVEVTFFNSQDAADLGENPIDTNITNDGGTTENIVARVQYSQYNYCYSTTDFTLDFKVALLAELKADSEVLEACESDPLKLSLENTNFETADVTVQWFKDDTLIEGADSTIFNATSLGYYKAEIKSNLSGCVLETEALLVLDKDCAAPVGPTAPGNLSVTDITDNSALASWTASSDSDGVASYEIYLDNVLLSSISELTYSLENLSESTAYTLKVVPIDTNDIVGTSSKVTFLTSESEDPTEPTDPIGVTNPNYAKDKIVSKVVGPNKPFTINDVNGVSLVVFNRSGQTIISKTNYKTGWDGSELSSGTYFYVITYSDNTTKAGTIFIKK
ncbi:MAG: fibronectin type III domain-containing protein [Flavicella sp.]